MQQRKPSTKMERQPIEWENIFANDTSENIQNLKRTYKTQHQKQTKIKLNRLSNVIMVKERRLKQSTLELKKMLKNF